MTRKAGNMKRALVGVTGITLAVSSWMVGTARAASSCTWDAPTATLSISTNIATPDTLVVSGVNILFKGSQCDPAATTLTVDSINVTVTPLLPGEDPTWFIVDLGGGQFAPGAEIEATGTSEIEFTFTGIGNLRIDGTSSDDVFSLGSAGVNVNSDDDPDMTLNGVPYVSVFSLDGQDTITGAGDSVVGGPLSSSGGLNAFGGDGEDSLTGGAGNDYLFGGLGNDDIRSGPMATGDVLGGGGGADSIIGGPWGDEIEGGDGDDLLDGRGGWDNLNGDAGHDQVTYADAGQGVNVDLARGFATGWGRDFFGEIEDVTGSSFGDIIVGNAAGNTLVGGSGRDRLTGRGGPDDLIGGPGRDRVSFRDSPRGVVVNLVTGHAGGWGSDSLSGIEDATGSAENDTLTGDSLANRLFGSKGNDTLFGGDDADNIRGGTGADSLSGGSGSDVLRGDTGTDTVTYVGSPAGVIVSLNGVADDGAVAEGDNVMSDVERVLGSSLEDSFIGNGAANSFWGRSGNDILRGRGGADRLFGRKGNDTFNGGPGRDRCVQGLGVGPKTSCELL